MIRDNAHWTPLVTLTAAAGATPAVVFGAVVLPAVFATHVVVARMPRCRKQLQPITALTRGQR
ncbi:hypothetical protein ACV229_31755, partial [Burkholderia sp. MR1-5-21]